jgi:hypothetical protein
MPAILHVGSCSPLAEPVWELEQSGRPQAVQPSGRRSSSGTRVPARPWAASSCACMRPPVSRRSAAQSSAPDRFVS